MSGVNGRKLPSATFVFSFILITTTLFSILIPILFFLCFNVSKCTRSIGGFAYSQGLGSEIVEIFCKLVIVRVHACVFLRSLLLGCVSKTKEQTVLMEFLEQQEVLCQKQCTGPDSEGP